MSTLALRDHSREILLAIAAGMEVRQTAEQRSARSENITPTARSVRTAAAEHGVDQGAALAEFRDYWRGVAGKAGVKLDWEATWRNWVRSQKQSFAKTQDLIHQTTPTPPNQDAALRKIDEDRKKAVPMPADIKAKMAELTKGIKV